MRNVKNVNLEDLSPVQIIDGKPYFFHINGMVIDGITMKRCGHVKKDTGYTVFGKNQSLHRWMYRVFANWQTHKTPNKFPGGYKAWKKLSSNEKLEFFWEFCVAHHKKGIIKGNGFNNLELKSGKENSQIGNNFENV